MFEDRDQGTFGAGTEEVITDEELNSNSQTKAISGDENKNDEEYSDKSSSSEPRSFRSFWELRNLHVMIKQLQRMRGRKQ